jgi:molecular chaperone IbpA
MAMATLDFAPLFRSSIGFDQLPGLLSHALERPEPGYFPYNIEKCGEDQYRIVMAVAGFGKDDVELVQEQNRLTIRGRLKEIDRQVLSAPRHRDARFRAPFRSRRLCRGHRCHHG